MAIRVSGQRERANPFQVRAQALRRLPPTDAAEAGMAFPPLAESDAGTERRGRWKQADLKRAIHVAEQAGLGHYRVEIAPDGTIAIVVGNAAAVEP